MKAKTDAERAKAYRERKKLRAAGLLAEPEPPAKLEIPRTLTLSEYVKAQGKESVEAIDWMQQEIDFPVGYILSGENKEKEIEWSYNIIESMITSLETMTGILSEYWTYEIDTEIERIKLEEIPIPEDRELALSKIVRFSAMRKNLQKRFRLTLQNFEPEEL